MDANADHVHQQAETGIAGVTVFIDANSNGVLDSGETSTQTAADGTYSFSGLAQGAYNVVVVPPAGSLATTSTTRIASVLAGQNLASVDFGFAQRG